MTWSQSLVIGWSEFTLAAAVLLQLAKWSLYRLPQPADRIRAIQLSLATTMVLPLLIAFAPWPGWNIRWLAIGEQPSLTVFVADPPSSPDIQSVSVHNPVPATSATPPAVSLPLKARNAAANPVIPSPTVVPDTPSPPLRQRWSSWMLAILAIGSAYALAGAWFLIEWALGIIILHRLCRDSSAPSTEIDHLWNQLTQTRGRHIRLLVSPSINVPLTFGWLRPTVLISRELASAGGTSLRHSLEHEWAHIARRDHLVWRLATVCQFVLWPLPAYWTLRRELRLCQDLLADDQATRAAGNPLAYSELLLDLARHPRTRCVTGALSLVDQPHQLTQRVRMLLDPPIAIRPASTWRFTFAAAFVAALFAVLVSSLRINAESPQPEIAKPEETQPLASDTGEFELRVVGPDGKPVPHAAVEIRTKPQPTAEQFVTGQFIKHGNYGTFAKANDSGRLVIQFSKEAKRFEVNITTPGYGPYWAKWSNDNHAEPVPARFTAELDAGWSVGGIVVDDSGSPVQGVAVHPNIKFKKRPGDVSELHIGTNLKTDAVGKWRFDSVPFSKSDVFVEINHPRFRPLGRSLTRDEFGLQFDQEPSAETALDPGLTVQGEVTDEAANPIVGALIRTKFMNDLRETRTDEEGLYKLSGCEPRTAKIVVSAPGKATDMQEVLIDPDMDPVDFRMQPGGKIRIEVQDQAGRPIPKARILYQRWRTNHFDYFELDHKNQYADENGVWVWNEAPLDEFQADICGPEMYLEKQRLIAREEPYVFRVPPALVVTGKVIDAETKQPIQKFTVVPGVRSNAQHMNWVRQEQFAATDGKYRMRQTSAYFAWLVRIEADGYLPVVSRDIKSNEGSITIDFELEKGTDVAATILTPDGQPAAQAEIALGVAGSQIELKNGKLEGTLFARQTADGEGHFRFPPQETAFQLLIVHPQGFAHVKANSESMPSTITLEPWARVAGVFRVGKQAMSNVPITIMTSTIRSYGKDAPHIFTHYDVTTGKDGRFAFERVVPGQARIGRNLILTVENGATEVTSCCLMAVDLHGGELNRIDLGGTGRPVIGRLEPPKGFDEKINWNFELIDVEPDLIDPPQPDEPQIPEDVQRDPVKKAEWLQKWQQTPVGQAWLAWQAVVQANEQLRKTRPYFRASLDRDGSFRIDDMPAGDYQLHTRFGRNAAGALRNLRFTVAEMEGGRSDEPLNLGVLRLVK